MDIRSPKFGTGTSTKPVSPPFYNPSVHSRSRSGNHRHELHSSGKPTDTPEAFPDSDHDIDRAELSMGLSARYMQLREEVSADKRRLRSLRDEYGRKKELLRGLLEASQQEEAARGRMRELSTALSNISTVAATEKPDLPSKKLEVLKRELRTIALWNHRISALLIFLDSQQQPIVKAPSVARSKSRSPVRTHWSP